MKSTQPKKCAKCGKHLSQQNKSGLCQYHSSLKFAKEYRKRYKEQHICISCQKPVEKVITIIGEERSEKYPIRCLACRERTNKRHREKNEKKNN